MNYPKLICAVALTILPLHSRAVDLSPHYKDTFTDAGVAHELFFLDGEGNRFGVCFNFETTVESGSGGSLFRIANFPDIALILRESPMSADLPFQGRSLQLYREVGRRLLPVWAMNVKVRAEEAEPLAINGWHSFRITYNFQSATAYLKRSVTFVNLNAREQIMLITASNEQSFDEASDRMWRLIRTWHALPKDGEKLALGK